MSPPYLEEKGLPFSTDLEFCGERKRVATRTLLLTLGAQPVKEEHGQPYKGARIDSNISGRSNTSLSTQGSLKNTRQFLYVFLISKASFGLGE